jgi:hypothetical protein
MIQHRSNRFLVFDDILFLIIADKSLKHHLHSIKLPVSQASDQINLTKASDRQTFAYFILLKSAISYMFQTVKRIFLGENTLPYRYLIVEKQILVDGLKTNDLCSFEKWVIISHIEEISVYFLMKDVGQIFCFDTCRKFDF